MDWEAISNIWNSEFHPISHLTVAAPHFFKQHHSVCKAEETFVVYCHFRIMPLQEKWKIGNIWSFVWNRHNLCPFLPFLTLLSHWVYTFCFQARFLWVFFSSARPIATVQCSKNYYDKRHHDSLLDSRFRFAFVILPWENEPFHRFVKDVFQEHKSILLFRQMVV